MTISGSKTLSPFPEIFPTNVTPKHNLVNFKGDVNKKRLCLDQSDPNKLSKKQCKSTEKLEAVKGVVSNSFTGVSSVPSIISTQPNQLLPATNSEGTVNVERGGLNISDSDVSQTENIVQLSNEKASTCIPVSLSQTANGLAGAASAQSLQPNFTSSGTNNNLAAFSEQSTSVASHRKKPKEPYATLSFKNHAFYSSFQTLRNFRLSQSDSKQLVSAEGSSGTKPVSLLLAADCSRLESDSCMNFSNSMQLKFNRFLKPLIVCPTGHIYLETFHVLSGAASDFLIAIAEPVSRPEKIHEYQITVFSLYAAIGIGYQVKDICKKLNEFSKNDITPELVELLEFHGNAFGRIKIVLQNNRYYLEATTKEDLEYMLSSPIIAENRIRNSMTTRAVTVRAPGDLSDTQPFDGKSDKNTTSNQTKYIYSFEVKADQVGRIKESALTDLKRPLVSEYDFRRDEKNCSMDIALKPTTKIRYYQERALRKMFSNGRARSGIIVLPCGAGKTLTGITAATSIRKSAMILTSSSVAVDQWKRAFIEFTTVNSDLVLTLTSDQKSSLPEDSAVILVSTYTMMAYSGKRSAVTEKVLQQIRKREWGLLIFDEVQYAPAPAFRKINDIVKSHCKLGLTATLVREDDLILDLQWLIGPKLYEANWLELQEAGYLAKVQVSEVWCPMTAAFYKEYLNCPYAKERNLWVCNPNKLRVCEYLLRFHEARNDKIIVFSDNLFALKEVALTLKKPFISGEVTMQERILILNLFKTSSKLNTIFLSKVGDNAIDIPCANVVIQISFNYASRRQEAQRLGRILRPKPKANEEFNAFFYSLISKDTQEMLYSDKRQQFIIDQGYAYKVLPISVFPMDKEMLLYDDPERQRNLLNKIVNLTTNQVAEVEEDEVMLYDSNVKERNMRIDDLQNVAFDQLDFSTVRSTLSTLSNSAGQYTYSDASNGPLRAI